MLNCRTELRYEKLIMNVLYRQKRSIPSLLRKYYVLVMQDFLENIIVEYLQQQQNCVKRKFSVNIRRIITKKNERKIVSGSG